MKSLIQFALAGVSILCLLGEMYGLVGMRFAVCAWLIPAAVLLFLWLIWASFQKDYETVTVIGGGACLGFIAAIVYDVYRIPFAMAGLPIFSVFPQFGRMILGGDAPLWGIQAAGWIYHFSNGMAFGIMYLAMARQKAWWWAMAWALGIEIMMLISPYPQVFGFKVTPQFLAVTLSAHLIFGLTLGLGTKRLRSLFPSFTA
jgi:hypothetical protein